MSNILMAAGNGASYKISELEFKDSTILDAMRAISELSGVNIVTTQEAAKKKVAIFLRDVTVEQAVKNLCKVTGLWYQKDEETGIIQIMDAEEYLKEIVVFRDERMKVFTMRHHNVVSAAESVKNLFGSRVELKLDRQDSSLIGLGVSGGGGENFTREPTSADNNSGNNSSNNNNSNNKSESEQERKSSYGYNQIQAIQDKSKNVEGLKGIDPNDIDRLARRPIAPIFITVNRLHNLLIVRTSDKDALDEIGTLLQQLDLKPAQVMLEMKILELTRGDSFRSIFDLNLTKFNDNGNGAGLGLGNYELEGGTLLFTAISNNIAARLQLLEEENRVEVLATPMLLASNNTPSRLFIGEERVLTTGVETTIYTNDNGTSSFGTISASTELRDIGNTLLIVPQINSDRSVTLSIQQDSSSVVVGGATIPVTGSNGLVQSFPIDTVNTANVEGAFLARDGLTMAIGGMIRESKTNSEHRVPYISDVPVLGNLFKRTVKDKSKTELILLITPHVFLSEDEAGTRTMLRTDQLSTHSYLEYGDPVLDKHAASSIETQPRKSIVMNERSSYKDNTKVQQYSELTRLAARKMQAKDSGSFYDEPSMQKVHITGANKLYLFGKEGVKAQPIASWKRGHYFVTAVNLSNHSLQNINLDTTEFPGKLLAVTLSAPQLKRRGSKGDKAYAYLITDMPFTRALSVYK